MNLEQKIEAILFYKNEPLEITKLSKLLAAGESETRAALKNLADSLSERGICLVMTKDEVSLATSPETKELIEQIAKDEMNREIGRAGLETLSIILYTGGASRREIDYIRGVNSNFILRNLSVRGLVEREPDTKDQRSFKYRPSLNLLAHLGIKKIEDLPEFESFKNKILESQEQAKTENE